tara:strand:+ start:2451 stop:3398 length:948 start_codon:yes stop_codon:yes gene_type:complete
MHFCLLGKLHKYLCFCITLLLLLLSIGAKSATCNDLFSSSKNTPALTAYQKDIAVEPHQFNNAPMWISSREKILSELLQSKGIKIWTHKKKDNLYSPNGVFQKVTSKGVRFIEKQNGANYEIATYHISQHFTSVPSEIAFPLTVGVHTLTGFKSRQLFVNLKIPNWVKEGPFDTYYKGFIYKYFTAREDLAEWISLFDYLIGNLDGKSEHRRLKDPNVYLIDHGNAFYTPRKMGWPKHSIPLMEMQNVAFNYYIPEFNIYTHHGKAFIKDVKGEGGENILRYLKSKVAKELLSIEEREAVISRLEYLRSLEVDFN